jgi:hypothetical protein
VSNINCKVDMSKVDDLKKKYPEVSTASFTKFVEGDTTPTKKYLEFMLKTWEDRKLGGHYRTTSTIIKHVIKFNELLPYIGNKDIYSKEYGNYQKLIDVIENAEQAREEKYFVKEEHINVILETEEFILLQPKTHKGSMKYGANTKWCTTTKNNESIFKNYTRDGFLAYLIDKSETKNENYRKVALYLEFAQGGLNESIKIYDVKDKYAHESHLIASEWEVEKLFQIFTTFRYHFIKTREAKLSRDFVNAFVNTISKLDFTKFELHLSRLDESGDLSYINKAQTKVESFIETLNNTKYGVRKT